MSLPFWDSEWTRLYHERYPLTMHTKDATSVMNATKEKANKAFSNELLAFQSPKGWIGRTCVFKWWSLDPTLIESSSSAKSARLYFAMSKEEKQEKNLITNIRHAPFVCFPLKSDSGLFNSAKYSYSRNKIYYRSIKKI